MSEGAKDLSTDRALVPSSLAARIAASLVTARAPAPSLRKRCRRETGAGWERDPHPSRYWFMGPNLCSLPPDD